MLVFSKRKYGGPVIDGVGIPGYLDPLPPARISFRSYWTHRYDLRQAPYNPERLRGLFGGNPPCISFCMSNIRYLSFSQLVELCRYFDIASSSNKSVEARRKAVREFLKEHG